MWSYCIFSLRPREVPHFLTARKLAEKSVRLKLRGEKKTFLTSFQGLFGLEDFCRSKEEEGKTCQSVRTSVSSRFLEAVISVLARLVA